MNVIDEIIIAAESMPECEADAKQKKERAEKTDRRYNRRNLKFIKAFQESFDPFRAAIADLKLDAAANARIIEVFDSSAAELKQKLVPDYRSYPYEKNN